jgi:hypothetical protein
VSAWCLYIFSSFFFFASKHIYMLLGNIMTFVHYLCFQMGHFLASGGYHIYFFFQASSNDRRLYVIELYSSYIKAQMKHTQYVCEIIFHNVGLIFPINISPENMIYIIIFLSINLLIITSSYISKKDTYLVIIIDCEKQKKKVFHKI